MCDEVCFWQDDDSANPDAEILNALRAAMVTVPDVPMVEADDIVIEALLDDVLDERLLEESVDEAVRLLQGDNPTDRIAAVEQERSRLVAAIAAGGQLDGLLKALQARETRHVALEAQRAEMHTDRRLRASDADRVRDELLTMASSWRQVLADDPTDARPIVSSLLKGRVTLTPMEMLRKRWTLSGEGSLVGLFERAVFPGMRELLSPGCGVPGRFRTLVDTRNPRKSEGRSTRAVPCACRVSH